MLGFRKHYSSLLCVLVLLGLLVRAAVPAGFMPGTDHDGMVTIVICTMQGAQTIEIPAEHSPLPVPQNQDHDKIADGMDMGPCAYAPVLTHHHPAQDQVVVPRLADGAGGPVMSTGITPFDTIKGKIWLSRGPPAA